MSRLLFFTGLGADERAFSKKGQLSAASIFVKWLPNQPNESQTSYARRIVSAYQVTQSDTLVGLSFGGLLAQEIALQLGNQKIILISSFQKRNHLRWPFRMALTLGLQVIPLIKIPIIEELVANVLNSANSESKQVLKAMIQSTDYPFMHWCIQKIAEIKPETYAPLSPVNIIGTGDRVLRTWENNNTHYILGGSHFMVYDRADEITPIILAATNR